MNESEQDRSQLLRTSLERFGDPHKTCKWETGEVDYVATLALTAADVPVLLTIAREWSEPQDWPDDEGYVAGYAPVHAWRALAQLRATEAIPFLLEMMGPLDEAGDDWYLEEFPHAFAWIGPSCLTALGDYLADAGRLTYPRVAASNGLNRLARRHPESRGNAVDALCQTLSRFDKTDHTVNAFIVSDLLDLKATEAAELIERAYAADCVDISINGNWNTVRNELGVSGLGLVPKELADARWNWLADTVAKAQQGKTPESVGQYQSVADDMEGAVVPAPSSTKIGRNEPCPCGSGKKFKKCCGR